MISCHPERAPLWQIIGVSLLWAATVGGLIFLALLFSLEVTAGSPASPRVKWAAMITAALVSALILVIFVRWDRDRWHWVLTEDCLIGGKKGRHMFPLASIVKIVPGLPTKVGVFLALNRFVHPGLFAALMVERKHAVVLKFVDGSCMAFHVNPCVGGVSLMNALRERLGDRLDPLYEYSLDEVEALKYADWNRVIRA